MPDDADTIELINALVDFIVSMIESRGHLNHHEAVKMAMDALCPPRVWWSFAHRSDERGTPTLRFRPEILQALYDRTGDSVIWEKNNRAWHKRNPRRA
jgi:hypothetical protein